MKSIQNKILSDDDLEKEMASINCISTYEQFTFMYIHTYIHTLKGVNTPVKPNSNNTPDIGFDETELLEINASETKLDIPETKTFAPLQNDESVCPKVAYISVQFY